MPVFLPLFWGLSIVALDQLSKAYISHILKLGQSIPVIPNIFHLSLVHNTGVAFGLFKKQNGFFIVISLVIILYIARDFIANHKRYNLTKRLGLILIWAGACGNLIDRLRLGYIVDFLDFRIWPVFNLADSAITIGVVILAVDMLFSPKRIGQA